jgi:hypothetical protein
MTAKLIKARQEKAIKENISAAIKEIDRLIQLQAERCNSSIVIFGDHDTSHRLGGGVKLNDNKYVVLEGPLSKVYVDFDILQKHLKEHYEAKGFGVLTLGNSRRIEIRWA